MSEMKRTKTNAIAQDIAFELELKLEKRERVLIGALKLPVPNIYKRTALDKSQAGQR